MTLAEYNGDWKRYIEIVFSKFHKDFIEQQPFLEGKRVGITREPMLRGKEQSFWHCISEGQDLRRCERISWIRAVIENSDDELVRVWRTQRGKDRRVCLWYAAEFLVVLRERKSHLQLVTAYYTDRKHTIKKLARDFKQAQKGQRRP